MLSGQHIAVICGDVISGPKSPTFGKRVAFYPHQFFLPAPVPFYLGPSPEYVELFG